MMELKAPTDEIGESVSTIYFMSQSWWSLALDTYSQPSSIKQISNYIAYGYHHRLLLEI